MRYSWKQYRHADQMTLGAIHFMLNASAICGARTGRRSLANRWAKRWFIPRHASVCVKCDSWVRKLAMEAPR